MKRLTALFIALVIGTLVLAVPGVEAQTSTITICMDTDPDSSDVFQFSGDLGAFTMAGMTCEDFDDLEPGEYTFGLEEGTRYNLESIKCLNGTPDYQLVRGPEEITINLVADQHVECLFDANLIVAPPTPTAVPTAALTPAATATPVPAAAVPQSAPQIVVVPVEVTRVVERQTVIISPPRTGEAGLR